MRRCPACGQRLAEWDEHSGQTSRAPRAPAPDDHRRYVRIARFKWAAEAGFFEHELAERLDVPTRILEHSNFDAMAGCWFTWYSLCVPEENAEHAQAVLRELIAEHEEDETDWQSEAEPSNVYSAAWPSHHQEVWDPVEQHQGLAAETEPESRSTLIPILLTLAAGAAVLWVTRVWPHQQPQAVGPGRGPEPATERFWQELSRWPEPWTQTRRDGRGVRQLEVDPVHQRILLREDADGDGTFEREVTVVEP
ncbi:MAG: hypothetical protein GXP27_17640 [Planctomycetes bacterium]|nr:hypothetical protein [Planctomycetota bacterium]